MKINQIIQKRAISEGTGDSRFDTMMGKITSRESLNAREAVAMMRDLIYGGGATPKEALLQASSSFEIDPKTLLTMFRDEELSTGIRDIEEDSQMNSKKILKTGSTVTVPHNGKMVRGKIVRYDSGKGGGHSPAYIVDIGKYESIRVSAHAIK